VPVHPPEAGHHARDVGGRARRLRSRRLHEEALVLRPPGADRPWPCGGSVVSAKGTRALCDTKREGSALVEGGKDHRGVPLPAPAPCRRSGLVRPDMARGNRGAQWTPSPSLALSPLSPVSACRPLSSRWKSRTGRAGSRLQEELAEPLFPFRRSSQRHPPYAPCTGRGMCRGCKGRGRLAPFSPCGPSVARAVGSLRSTSWG